ncbi:hypothetical protein L596_011118 [Steinernema carpocapsae]|uniref:CHCH domain-containing protein n=1 Tax=Steinernema carpocapsae TaxID=34508 RepID=A0A4U5NTT7_STECR|nr:hypothetical protein L596_011118 [Steinernema carpocapsae]
MSHHGKSEWAKSEEEEDRVETLIKASGCWDGHLGVVDCMSEKRDWRKCQDELVVFRECMQKAHQQRKQEQQPPKEAPAEEQPAEKK